MYDPTVPSRLRNFFFSYARASRSRRLLLTLLFVFSGSVFALAATLFFFSLTLPDYRQLIDYDPSKTTRVYANNGVLISEFAVEKRVFVPIDALPQPLLQAFIAAEDKTFYEHFGLDLKGIMRAISTNLQNLTRGSTRLVGASTITQQVAKNFLLSREKTLTRKLREAILAIRIERVLSKDRILELYLNEIYLGRESYGVASAARSYFGVDVRSLTLEQAAYLAALPKAPNRYNPHKHYEKALGRRNWVLSRMLANEFIDEQQYEKARSKKLYAVSKPQRIEAQGSFFAEEVRRKLVERFGETELYHGGLVVHSTLDPQLQIFAERALQRGIRAYDRRHGYRGHIGKVYWKEQNGDPSDLRPFVELRDQDASGGRIPFEELEKPVGALEEWLLVRVEEVGARNAVLATQQGRRGTLSIEDMRWAREQIRPSREQVARQEQTDDLVLSGGRFESSEDERTRERLGEQIKSPSDLLAKNDVLLVARKGNKSGVFSLEQVPQVNGALIAMDPFNGAVLALVGGWSFDDSEFNRGTQAMRQPGSSFKPFVYLSALESRFTPATRILDAPFVLFADGDEPKWKPSNFTKKFYGPSPMRLGIEHSRNLMTVRLAQAVGMDKVADTTRRFGIIENMPQRLALALGSGETTLLRMVAGYAMFANGGRKITPGLIERIQHTDGETLYRRERRTCEGCAVSDLARAAAEGPPQLALEGERVTDEASAYQIVTMLQGVVDRGTGRRVRAEVAGEIAGKTGTTNNNQDAWFVGFSPRLAAGVYIGFDQPRSLGRLPSGHQETGSSAAAPIFAEFMRKALKGKVRGRFRQPRSVEIVTIDRKTGGRVGGDVKLRLESSSATRMFNEVFKLGNAPKSEKESLLITGGSADPTQQEEQQSEVPALGIY